MIRILSTAALFTALIAWANPAAAQGDQPMPTPPGPTSKPAASATSTPATPPAAPKQGDDPGIVTPPPPKEVKKTPPPPPKKGASGMPLLAAQGPVQRATNNWGMFWRFGGLATLAHAGNARTVQPGFLGLTHVGVKYAASETWMFPIYAGLAFGVVSPDNGDSSAAFGIEVGGGVEYHFRIWRRISPFVGATLGLFYTNPSGTDNWDIGVGVGPVLGIEYYIGDRLSLQALYTFVIAFAAETRHNLIANAASTRTSFGFFTSAGGALNITYYF